MYLYILLLLLPFAFSNKKLTDGALNGVKVDLFASKHAIWLMVNHALAFA